jgi:hypothetical protein
MYFAVRESASVSSRYRVGYYHHNSGLLKSVSVFLRCRPGSFFVMICRAAITHSVSRNDTLDHRDIPFPRILFSLRHRDVADISVFCSTTTTGIRLDLRGPCRWDNTTRVRPNSPRHKDAAEISMTFGANTLYPSLRWSVSCHWDVSFLKGAMFPRHRNVAGLSTIYHAATLYSSLVTSVSCRWDVPILDGLVSLRHRYVVGLSMIYYAATLHFSLKTSVLCRGDTLLLDSPISLTYRNIANISAVFRLLSYTATSEIDYVTTEMHYFLTVRFL